MSSAPIFITATLTNAARLHISIRHILYYREWTGGSLITFAHGMGSQSVLETPEQLDAMIAKALEPRAEPKPRVRHTKITGRKRWTK